MQELDVIEAIINVRHVCLVILALVPSVSHHALARRIHRRLIRSVTVREVKAHRIGRMERRLLTSHHFASRHLRHTRAVLDLQRGTIGKSKMRRWAVERQDHRGLSWHVWRFGEVQMAQTDTWRNW